MEFTIRLFTTQDNFSLRFICLLMGAHPHFIQRKKSQIFQSVPGPGGNGVMLISMRSRQRWDSFIGWGGDYSINPISSLSFPLRRGGKGEIEKKFLNGNSAETPAGILYARGLPVRRHRQRVTGWLHPSGDRIAAVRRAGFPKNSRRGSQ